VRFEGLFYNLKLAIYAFIAGTKLTLPFWLLGGKKCGWNRAPFKPLPYGGAEHACFWWEDSLRAEEE
jgi:hypothetical protein